MSENENQKEAGRRLAGDLKAIRKKRGLGVEELLKATRLPPDILEKFDDTALVDHPAFNRVYLRSIISSYAVAIDVDVAAARDALEHAIAGTYQNTLRTRYLDEGELMAPGDTIEDADSDGGPETAEAEKVEAEEAEEPDVVDETDEIKDVEETVADTVESISKVIDDTPAVQPAPTAVVHQVTEERTRSIIPERSRIMAIAITLILLLAYIFWPSGGDAVEETVSVDDNPPSTQSPGAVSSSTIAMPAPERVVLADSMEFLVIAAHDLVDPIRISRDRWARRPYWIPLGDTMVVRAANSVIFESDISSARIELFGYTLSDSLINPRGQIVLSRERAQRWLDAAVFDTTVLGTTALDASMNGRGN